MMKKKQAILIIGGIILLAILIFFLCLFGSKVNNEPDLIIGFSSDSFGHSPIIIGKELGLFEKEGLKVKYIPFTSAKYSRQAIATGQINIATGGANNYFDPISKGINIKLIAPMVLSPSYAFVRPNDINTLADLNNTVIASRIDGTTGYAFKKILQENNLNLNITYNDVEKAYAPIALMDKKIIDAALNGAESKEGFFKAGAIVLPEWEEKGYTNRYFLSTSIVVDENFANSHPEVVNKFINGYIATQKFMKENPEETREILTKYMNKSMEGVTTYTVEDVNNALSSLEFVLWIDSSEFLDIANYATETGTIDKNLSIDEIYDNRYEEKLRKAQEEIYGKLK